MSSIPPNSPSFVVDLTPISAEVVETKKILRSYDRLGAELIGKLAFDLNMARVLVDLYAVATLQTLAKGLPLPDNKK